MHDFILLKNDGDYYQDSGDRKTRFIRWENQFNVIPPSKGGVIGFVTRDSSLKVDGKIYPLPSGSYFATPYRATLVGGQGVVLTMQGYAPLFSIGGPIEVWGRLRYIDGCTDTLLIPPVRKGDPCFNALYFPPGVNQTQHTHPSLRAGVVVSGEGQCLVPGRVIPLTPGTVFVIETDGLHSFRTSSTECMTVVAYHPDSDFGPEDTDHPMVNRTIVDGVSASDLPDIQTGRHADVYVAP